MEPDPDSRGQNMGNKKIKAKKFMFFKELDVFWRARSFS
jgi:hypothetical protein